MRLASSITSVAAGLIALQLLRTLTDWPWLARVGVATVVALVATMVVIYVIGSIRARSGGTGRPPGTHPADRP